MIKKLLSACILIAASTVGATPISDGVWVERTWTTEWTPFLGSTQIIPDPAERWAAAGATYDPIGVMPNDLYSGLGRPTVSSSGKTIPYTHYVDSNDGGCTDTSNDGTVATPRCTFPAGTSLSPGDVVVVASGTHVGFNYGNDGGNGPVEGSVTQPIFIWGMCSGDYNSRQKGNGCPVITPPARDQNDLFGKHIIVDGFDLNGGRLRMNHNLNGTDLYPDQSYITIRNIRQHHGVKGSWSFRGHSAICYRCKVDHNEPTSLADAHGFAPGPSQYVWILQGAASYNSGDGMQWCHSAGDCAPGDVPLAKYVYTDQMDFHHNRENGWDTKFVDHAVLSRSRIWGHIGAAKDQPWCYADDAQGRSQYDPSCPVYGGGSDGASIIVGSNGCLGTSLIGSENIFIIFNEFLDNTRGIRIECGQDLVIAGNIFYQGNKADYPSIVNNTVESIGVAFEKKAANVRIYGNVFADLDRGLARTSQPNNFAVVRNNIFYNVDSVFQFGNESNCIDGSEFDNNLVYHTSGSVIFGGCANTPTTITATTDFDNDLIQNMANLSTGNVFDSAGGVFVDDTPGSGDYRLATGSEAIDIGGDWQGFLTQELQTNSNDAKLSLNIDFLGQLIPSAGSIDAGAIQGDAGVPSSDTTPPSCTISPVTGATINTNTLNIDLTCNEALSNVDNTDLTLTGTGFGSATKGTTSNPSTFVYRFPVTGLVDGSGTACIDGNITDGASPANDLAEICTTITVSLPTGGAGDVSIEDLPANLYYEEGDVVSIDLAVAGVDPGGTLNCVLTGNTNSGLTATNVGTDICRVSGTITAEVGGGTGTSAPPIFSVTKTESPANGTTGHTVSMPTTASGEGLILSITTNGDNNNENNVTAGLTGWTLLGSQTSLGGATETASAYIYYKTATGSETNLSLTLALSNRSLAANLILLRNIGNWATTPPEISTLAASTDELSSAPNATAVTPAGGSAEYQLITIAATDRNVSVTTYPTNYTSNQTSAVSQNSSGGVGNHVASRIATITSEDAGAWALSSGQEWAAWTIAVSPPGSGTAGAAASSPFSLSLEANDNGINNDTTTSTLTVVQTNGIPVAPTGSDFTFEVDSAISATSWTCTDDDTVTYSAGTGLTALGIAINSSTGAITGTPTATGNALVEFKCTDLYGAFDTELVMVVVEETTTPITNPVITSDTGTIGGEDFPEFNITETTTSITTITASNADGFRLCTTGDELDDDNSIATVNDMTGAVTIAARDFEQFSDDPDAILEYRICWEAYSNEAGTTPDQQYALLRLANTIETSTVTSSAAATIQVGSTEVAYVATCDDELTANPEEGTGDDAALFTIDSDTGLITKDSAAQTPGGGGGSAITGPSNEIEADASSGTSTFTVGTGSNNAIVMICMDRAATAPTMSAAAIGGIAGTELYEITADKVTQAAYYWLDADAVGTGSLAWSMTISSGTTPKCWIGEYENVSQTSTFNLAATPTQVTGANPATLYGPNFTGMNGKYVLTVFAADENDFNGNPTIPSIAENQLLTTFQTSTRTRWGIAEDTAAADNDEDYQWTSPTTTAGTIVGLTVHAFSIDSTADAGGGGNPSSFTYPIQCVSAAGTGTPKSVVISVETRSWGARTRRRNFDYFEGEF